MAVLTFNTSRKSSFYPAATSRKLLLIEFSVSAFADLSVVGFLEKLKREKKFFWNSLRTTKITLDGIESAKKDGILSK